MQLCHKYHPVLQSSRSDEKPDFKLSVSFQVDKNTIPFDLQSQAMFQQFSFGFGYHSTDFLRTIPNLIEPNATVTFSGPKSFSLMDVIKQNPLSSYYAYRGSLTTVRKKKSDAEILSQLLTVFVSSLIARNRCSGSSTDYQFWCHRMFFKISATSRTDVVIE